MERLLEGAYAPEMGLRIRLALSRVRDEGLLVCVVGVYIAVLCSRLASQVGQDSWLVLVAGRDIVAHGLPSHDHLTYWTAGTQWVDQQWLAQLFFYGLAAAGGAKLALFAHAALITATFVLALGLARAQGASPRATAWIAVLSVIPIVSGSWQMRAQTIALFFFVLLLWLLVTDARRPSRRIYLVLPLIVLWANVHGSVVIGAAFVGIYALTSRAGGWRRAIGLVIGAGAGVLVTPYGPAMLAYYKSTLLNPALMNFVTEWQPTTLRPLTAPVYVLALGGIWLLASRGSRVPRFQKVAFLVAAVLALLAVRNLAFLGLTALVALPAALDDVLPRRAYSPRRLDAFVAGTAVALIVLSAPLAWRSVSVGIDHRYPPEAAAAVARATAADPQARVLSDVKFADWLLWERPDLAGRVAYDARFELMSYRQVRSAYYWTNQVTADWKAAARDARVIVLDRDATDLNEKPLLAERGARRLYRDGEISVLERPARPGRP